MTEEEKEAILNLDTLAINGLSLTITEDIQKDIQIVLNLVQKLQEENNNKDKQIDLMAKQLNKLICNIDFDKKLQEGEDYSECIEEYIREQMKEGV